MILKCNKLKCIRYSIQKKTITVNLKQCIRYAYCADKRRYWHNGRADKWRYQHDRRADSQCPDKTLMGQLIDRQIIECLMIEKY